MSESNVPLESHNRLVVLTGATGYVGSRLLARLKECNVKARCFARTPDDLKNEENQATELVEGDVLEASVVNPSHEWGDDCIIPRSLEGIIRKFLTKQDREAAKNFATAAKEFGVLRIIYMGGLGDESDPTLSPHLKSRHEVGRISRDSGVVTIEFRASVVIGNGSLSFDLIRSLTHRLPVMICPRWLATPTQPIAIDDVLDYLLKARELPADNSQILEIGSSDVVTYGQLIRLYAQSRGLRR